jgi:hypothetical protein
MKGLTNNLCVGFVTCKRKLLFCPNNKQDPKEKANLNSAFLSLTVSGNRHSI